MIKLKQIESICKKRKTVITTEAAGSQWIGDGSAFYPVSGLPKLTRENIFTIFDVPWDKRENFFFQETKAPDINFEDADPTEKLAGKGDAYVIYNGLTLCPIAASQGLMLLDAKYLRPFFGTDDGFDVYERINSKGQSYFAIKQGFILLGIILPVKVLWKPFIDTLNNWATWAVISESNEREAQMAQMRQEGILDEQEADNGAEE